MLGQLGLGGASAGGILLRVLARLEDNRAEAVLRAVLQWQFEPANYDSNPVEAMMMLRVPVK